MISPQAGSTHGSHPSLDPLCEEKHANSNEDYEADRSIGSGKIVPLGKLVNKLPKAAEIDQKFDSHDVDQCEDQTEPESNEDSWQRGGKQDLPELLRPGQIEAFADVDQHAPRGQQAFQRLEEDGCESGGEAHHHDSQGAPAEDHEIERIHQNEWRRRDRRDPGLGRKSQQMIAVEHDPARDADNRQKDAGGESLTGGEQETLQHVLLDNYARKRGDDVGRHRHDEAVDDADANEQLEQCHKNKQRADAERGRKKSVLGNNRGHRPSPSRSLPISSSLSPRLASSRRSLQIWATYRPNASLETISELRGRGSAISTTRFTWPGR